MNTHANTSKLIPEVPGMMALNLDISPVVDCSAVQAQGHGEELGNVNGVEEP